MSKQELDINSILRFLIDIYGSLHKNDCGPPSKLCPQDRSTVPRGLNTRLPLVSDQESPGATKALPVDKLLAILKTCLPSGSKGKQSRASPYTHPCHKCGKLGQHWANKCPDKRNDNKTGLSNGEKGSNRVLRKTTSPVQPGRIREEQESGTASIQLV
jgi:hypothetical protein